MGHDVVVIGCGGVGSAALLHLASRGVDVVGLDRFPPGHDRGSSHGHTRIIRRAYFEHPDYVPLLDRAYTLWDRLEASSGRRLFVRSGLLEVGPADGVVVPGVLEAAAQHDLDIERLDVDAVAERYPGFVVPDGSVAVFEQDAGFLFVEEAVRTHAEQARAAGAEVRTGVEVTGWRAGTAGGVVVQTSDGPVEADGLVVTAGAWADGMLGDLGVPLVPRRKQLQWFDQHDAGYHVDAGCPGFFYELPEGMFYGFPAVDGRGVKIAEHTGGRAVDDPLSLDRDLDVDEAGRAADAIRRLLPGVTPTVTSHAACMYTMSPDEHFVVDTHPEHPRVAFAAGLSGHGFKFTSALGELLADLVLDGSSSLPHGFLGVDRF